MSYRYRYKKNNIYKQKVQTKKIIYVKRKTLKKTFIKKNKRSLRSKHLQISLRKSRHHIYKRFKASRNLLNHCIKKFLGRNDLAARKKKNRSRFVTFIRIYKQDIKNQYCLKMISNPKILNRILLLLRK